jgi:hypothetical protein
MTFQANRLKVNMADESRKKHEQGSEEAPVSAKSAAATSLAPSATAPPEGDAESHLALFSKPYNEYFEGIQEAHRAHVQRASEIYGAYVKAVQSAIEKRDRDAFNAAAEQFNTALPELGKAFVTNVDRTFSAYHGAIRSVFASGASSVLGPGCLLTVGRSIAIVSWHRLQYGRG